MRTLCTQFIRSRMLNLLVAIYGVLTTLSLLLYYLLFHRLRPQRLGLSGYSDALFRWDDDHDVLRHKKRACAQKSTRSFFAVR